MRPRFLILPSSVVILSIARPTGAAESCNQTDVAQNLQPRLTARDAGDSKPVDRWGPCPIAEPYGPCTPAAHATLTTATTRKILDPDAGK